MIAHILLDNLREKLPFVNRAISQRAQLPILHNVLMKAKNGKLHLYGTDIEIGIEVVILANIEEEGEVAIPAKTFLELINTLTDEKILLHADNNTLKATTKTTKNTFQTTPTEDFPKLYEEKGEEIFSFKKDEITNDLGKVHFAAATDTTRPALSGIYIGSQKGMLVFVATDGYRLSLKEKKSLVKKEQTLLIPSRILREVIAVGKIQDEIKLYTSDKNNQVLFEGDGILLVGRLIDAEFPNYQKIIPKESTTKVFFNRQDLQKAVKTASIFAREAANIVKFSIKENKIVVSANAPSVGENTIDVEAKIDGDENEIAFNVRYLLDLLSNVEEEEMVFEMSGPLHPGVFKIKGDQTFLHLIMPIRVQG